MKRSSPVLSLSLLVGVLLLGACSRPGPGAAAPHLPDPARLAIGQNSLPPAAELEQSSAHTVRFASPAQARALTRAMAGEVIDVTVDCCHQDAVDFAVADVIVRVVTEDLPNSVPVFVHCAQPERAVVTAARLAATGLGNVFVVND